MNLQHLSINEIKEYRTSLKAYIHNAKMEIKYASEKIGKRIASTKEKNRESDIYFLANSIRHQYETIAKNEAELIEVEKELELKELTLENEALDPILREIEKIEKEDAKWYDEHSPKAKAMDYKERDNTYGRVMGDVLRLKREEALKVFAADRRARYRKVVKAVNGKIGKPVKASLELNENGGLDGYIVGEEAVANFTTFGAGGWNIQRFHFRTKLTIRK